MRLRFWLLAALSLGATCPPAWGFDYFSIEAVTVDTEESDLWPVSNLIQGPGVGFNAEEPHEKILGGAEGNWVTADDAGFPSDYIEDVRQPVIQLDLGEERLLKEISVWGYASTNANGTSRFSLRFASEAEGGPDGILGNIDYGNSISYNPTFDLSNVDTDVQQYKLFGEHVTARYVEFTNVDNFFIAPGQNPGPESLDDVEPRLLPFVPGGDRVGLGEIAFLSLPASFQPGDKLAQQIDGDALGSLVIPGTQTGREFSAPSAPEPGLLQEWYDVAAQPTNKGAIDTVFATSTPIVEPFRASDGSMTWWSGSADVLDIPKYPEQLPDDFVGDTYAVRLTGELLVEESGTVRFLDGVDDYAYLAIDLDRSGVAGDVENEILIDDNTYTDALSVANGGAPIVEADFEGVAAGGEWFNVEFNMAEGGGGDSGMLYWDALDEDLVFPDSQGTGVFDLDAFFLVIPETHLRSSERELLKADAIGTLADHIDTEVFEFSLQVGPDGSDQIALQPDLIVGDGQGTLDVSGTTVRIIPDGALTEGDEFQIFVADEVIGIESMTLLLDDPALWNTSQLSQGILIYGPGGGGCDPNSMGDLDGNGMVEFADFLVLSSNFGTEVADHTAGDIDCSGSVDFADFLALSGQLRPIGGRCSVGSRSPCRSPIRLGDAARKWSASSPLGEPRQSTAGSWRRLA